MPRNQTSQTKHNREVHKIAESYKKRGYDVNADLQGYSKPKSIGGYTPDVVARKGGQKTIVEVETPDSVNSSRDLMQQGAFKKAASNSDKTHYKRVVTK